MKKYTFDSRYAAHTCKGRGHVFIPDQVARDQRAFDGRRIPVMRQDGTLARATLRGDLYGLGTPGVGDPVVAMS